MVNPSVESPRSSHAPIGGTAAAPPPCHTGAALRNALAEGSG